VRADSTVVMRARSANGASGLITHQQVDLSTHPVIEWRWRIESTVDGGDVTKKGADDSAARLYVTFDYGGLGWFDRLKLAVLRGLGHDNLPTRALNCVWASHLPTDTMHPSPYTDQIMVLPVRSSSTRVGEWVRERRNVRADYRKAFGEAPPPVAVDGYGLDPLDAGPYDNIVFRSAQETTNGAPKTLPSGGDS